QATIISAVENFAQLLRLFTNLMSPYSASVANTNLSTLRIAAFSGTISTGIPVASTALRHHAVEAALPCPLQGLAANTSNTESSSSASPKSELAITSWPG